MSVRSPIAGGVILATLAAVAFGITTPIVAWAGAGLGPFTTAALLYAGAAGAALVLRLFRRNADAPLRRSDRARVAMVALLGGAIAPALLAWGLQHAGATIGSLLLNLEAVFTILLARAFHREPIGARVALAVLAMVAGGVALTFDAWQATRWSVVGVAAIAGATIAWAADNTVTRPLAERDPLDVVAAKAGLGALITTTVAVVAREPWPAAALAGVLVACGATGYGLSLRLYLLAQRRIGAGRTGSVFALAPFVGAALAFALGDRGGSYGILAAALLFAAGVYLHVSERHEHHHTHEAVAHDHVHRHDDGHHTHAHDPPFLGEHAHVHAHERVEHAHDHAPDVHHTHEH